MKKVFMLVAMVCALGMMTAMAQWQTILVAPSREYENLKGPVRVVQTAIVDMDGNEMCFPLIKTMIFEKSGTLHYSVEKMPLHPHVEKYYSTNANNQLECINRFGWGRHDYHYRGRKLQYISYLPAEYPEDFTDTMWVNEYNADGLPSIIQRYSTCSKFEYFANGNVKKEELWDVPLSTSSEKYFYNEKGQLDSIIRGPLRTKFCRDDRGNVIEQTIGRCHGTSFDDEAYTTTYRYLQYDNYGNWILREITYPDTSIWREQRSIIYYE